jgi:membrane protein implicated in regulation of membrane protease activity
MINVMINLWIVIPVTLILLFFAWLGAGVFCYWMGDCCNKARRLSKK